MRALVIDDEADVRSTLREMLTRLGMEVADVADGREGISELDRHGADLVLLDWGMAGVDGISFLQSIRSDPRWRDMRVMMVSGRTDLDEVSRALDAGANEYMMKPFTQRALREKLLCLGIRLPR